MLIALYCLIVYLIFGLGFFLASWLQAAEIKVNKGGEPYCAKDLVLCFYFAVSWPIIALYCLRVDVLKNAKPVDWDALKAKNRS